LVVWGVIQTCDMPLVSFQIIQSSVFLAQIPPSGPSAVQCSAVQYSAVQYSAVQQLEMHPSQMTGDTC
jgi:hypothetical protein